MKKIIIAGLLGAASINASAIGFAPWEQTGKANNVTSAEHSADVSATGPFYRVDAVKVDTPDARQVEVDIKPWYFRDQT